MSASDRPWTPAEMMFGRDTGRHSHPATHPWWMQFSDYDCPVCGHLPNGLEAVSADRILTNVEFRELVLDPAATPGPGCTPPRVVVHATRLDDEDQEALADLMASPDARLRITSVSRDVDGISMQAAPAGDDLALPSALSLPVTKP